MKKNKIYSKIKTGAAAIAFAGALAGMGAGLAACSSAQGDGEDARMTETSSAVQTENASTAEVSLANVADTAAKEAVEKALDLKNMDSEWTYNNGAWVLTPVTAVTNPEIADEQGVSVAVPEAYVKGIDTTGNGEADVTAENASSAVKGNLVIDTNASVTSANGQIYTAATAPLILTTGAAGYSEQQNQSASTQYAQDGYISIACGNRGKQSQASDGSYTGDAPLCLVDQKNAARFVKYNILLGNLPGCADYLVTTGGSGGGAHAAMFAATSNNPDFYAYEAEAGAVGVYKTTDGSYVSGVTVDGTDMALSDGAWGCVAYSAITPLASADMAQAFEYYLDEDYSYNTDFQAKMSEYLSEEYMEYVNSLGLKADEAVYDLDINGDGDKSDTVDLTIEYDANADNDTNGYSGTYLDLYTLKMQQSLQWYVDNLAYGEGWTWFNTDGSAMSNEEVTAMTSEDRAKVYIEGRYSQGSTGSSSGNGGPGGAMTDGPGGMGPGGRSEDGAMQGGLPDLNGEGGAPSGGPGRGSENMQAVGTPDSGTTQSASSSKDSANYATFAEMLAEYESDIASVQSGDKYGNNIVSLYDPMNYIGDEDTEGPVWTRILMGAQEGDMSMFSSMNMQAAWNEAGTDSVVDWQWNGGHVPSEIFGDSLSLYVDQMYGEYVDGAVKITKPAATAQTENGSATEADGEDLSSWVTLEDGQVTFDTAAAAAYRAQGASKAVPGFDVIDYGQEDYEFGSSEKDARHWDEYVLRVFKAHEEELAELFNK